MLFFPVPSAALMPSSTATGSIASSAASGPVDMPLASVTTVLESRAAFNNSKNAVQTRPSALSSAPAPSPLSFSGLLQESSLNPMTFSSAFMAQWIAQSSPSMAVSIAQLYVNDNVPRDTLDSRLMEIYSLVKYKPSFAGKPIPEPVSVPPLTINPPQEAAEKLEILTANPAFSVSQNALQPRAEAVHVLSPAGVAPLFKKIAQNDNVESPPPANDVMPKTVFGSLIKEGGVKAYQASFMRNQAHLSAEAPGMIDQS